MPRPPREDVDCDEDFSINPTSVTKDCMCSMSSRMVKSQSLCLEWKKCCNFCKLRARNLKQIIEMCDFNYLQYISIFTLDELLVSKTVIQKLLLKDETIPIRELVYIHSKLPDTIINLACLKKVKNPLNQDSRNLLKLAIIHFKRLSYTQRCKNKLILEEIFEKLDEAILDDNMVVGSLLESCLELQLYPLARKVLPHVTSFHMYTFSYLRDASFPFEFFLELLPKITNVFEVISYESRIYYNRSIGKEIDVKIDVSRLETSLQEIPTSDLVKWYNRTYIMYYDSVTGKNFDGIDATGLTKDFYTIISSEIRKHLVLDDSGFLLIPSEPRSEKWLMLGVLLARSIINHNLAPELNLHPLYSYYVMSYKDDFTLKSLIEFCKPFDTEFFENVQKVLRMQPAEYTSFLELMEESTTPKKVYVREQIEQRFMNDNARQFIGGLQSVLKERRLCDVISYNTLHNYLSKTIIYQIQSDSPHSLKSNIVANSETFKAKFLEALEYLNVNDPEKLKKFFQFWFGTAGMESFRMDPAPRVSHSQPCTTYFKSHTCFNELEFNTKGKLEVKDILSSIDNTLLNQDLSLSVGMSMQAA
jgi:hypothetical protein